MMDFLKMWKALSQSSIEKRLDRQVFWYGKHFFDYYYYYILILSKGAEMKPKNLEKGEENTKIWGIPENLFPSWLTYVRLIELLIYHH